MALDALERALLGDGFRGIALVIAALADGLDKAGSLNTARELPDDRKGALCTALLYFCINHVGGIVTWVRRSGKRGVRRLFTLSLSVSLDSLAAPRRRSLLGNWWQLRGLTQYLPSLLCDP